MNRPPSSGRFRVEERALRPAVEPNGNEGLFPASVGEDVDVPGDASGVQLMGFADLPAATPLAAVIPSPWSGWPAEWQTPRWSGMLAPLVDTAFMCLDLNSSISASMPPYLVNASQSFADEATWLENPNPDIYSSWWEFYRSLLWDYLMGEAFLLATSWNRFGYPSRFHLVEPWLVNVEMTGGVRDYSIGGVPVPPGDLLHLRYRSSARDARGHGPLESGQARVVAAAALVRYASTLVSAGGIPPGLLEGDMETTAEQAEQVQAQWHNPSKAGMIRVTFGGVKWRSVQMSPKDMALAELEAMNAGRLASLMRVPPFLVSLPGSGDPMTYQNAGHVFDFHWRAHLRTINDGILRGMSAWLTPRATRLEVNRDDYVSPPPAEAASMYSTLHSIEDADGRVLTVPEIRERMRLDNQAAPLGLPEGVLR